MNVSAPLFPTWSNPLALSFPVQTKKSDWRYVSYTQVDQEGGIPLRGFVNMADLPEDGMGEIPVYGQKSLPEHVAILVQIAVAYPLEAAATITYNLLRIVPVVIFITGHLFYEWATQKDDKVEVEADVKYIEDLRKAKKDVKKTKKTFKAIALEHLKEIGRQVWLSIANVIRTPIYLVGILFGILYAFVKPLDGRQWVSKWDFDWNHRIPRSESLWLTMGFQREFCFESFQFKTKKIIEEINSQVVINERRVVESHPISKLGYQACYIAGCYQPNQIASIENFELKEIKGLSKNHSYTLTDYESTNKTCYIVRECLL